MLLQVHYVATLQSVMDIQNALLSNNSPFMSMISFALTCVLSSKVILCSYSSQDLMEPECVSYLPPSFCKSGTKYVMQTYGCLSRCAKSNVIFWLSTSHSLSESSITLSVSLAVSLMAALCPVRAANGADLPYSMYMLALFFVPVKSKTPLHSIIR